MRTFLFALAALSLGGGQASALDGAAAAAPLDAAADRMLMAEAAAEHPAIAAVFRAAGYAPLWTDDAPDDLARRAALVAALAAAGDHGLPPGQHAVAQVHALLAAAGDARGRAAAEIGISEIFLRYAREVAHGVLVPSEVDPGIVREVPYAGREALLASFASAADPARFLRALAPASPEYARLMKARIGLAEIAAGRGWGPAVEAGLLLRPGETGAAVTALRDRLVRMGYLPRSAAPGYDDALRSAVRTFQADHGLAADGIAGPETLAEINVAPEARLRQVLVAMERERWTNMPRGSRHIWVNLADFSAQIVDNGVVSFTTRAVIGANEADRRSPEFSDVMEHMVVNPTWHVPRSITVGEYLPQIQANPWAASQLEIVDRSGRVIPREAVDWRQFSPQNFPFRMRQPPSESNALGVVKFMFPNQWNIYLHDTPSKSLFDRHVRAFSHGCIRLSDPFDFAYALLAPQTDDPVGFFQARLRGGAETTVPLAEPVQVHLVYRTAIAPAKGRVNFRRDVYGRDAKVSAALEAAGVVPVALEG